VSNHIRQLKTQMAAHLRETRPDEPITEPGRQQLCGQLTQHREPDRQELVNATPPITRPTTRGEYGTALWEALRHEQQPGQKTLYGMPGQGRVSGGHVVEQGHPQAPMPLRHTQRNRESAMTPDTASVLTRLAHRLEHERASEPITEDEFPELIRDAAWSNAQALTAALKAPDITPGETRGHYAARLRQTCNEGGPHETRS